MHSYTGSSLFSLGSLLREQGIPHSILTPDISPIDRARNVVSAMFLQSGHSHLLCIDADMQFSPQSVLDLLEMGVDFAAATYRLKRPETVWCHRPLEGEPSEGVFRVAAVGFGFVLLRLEVFAAVEPLVPKLYSSDLHRMIPDHFGPVVIQGERAGEDVSFCHRWRDAGGDIWLNRDIKLGHYGGCVYG